MRHFKYIREHILKEFLFQGKSHPTNIIVAQNDITKEEVDAIVNAANEYLKHGGGVAFAISRAGGPTIQRESDEYVSKNGKVRTGSAGITSGGNLKAKYVIHAVGPIWNDGKSNERELLSSAVMSSLKIASKYQIKSIAIPAISSGIFGFPKDQCAEVLFSSVEKFLDENENNSLEEIRFTNKDGETVSIFIEEFKKRYENSI